VIGVTVTGVMLERNGGSSQLAGWYQAYGTSLALVLAGSGVFLAAARGDRIFGETDLFEGHSQ
jgi:hypothetical protein